MLQILLVFRHFMCHGHCHGQIWNWLLKKWLARIIHNTCLLVLVCAMDCNPRVQLIHTHMPV